MNRYWSLIGPNTDNEVFNKNNALLSLQVRINLCSEINCLPLITTVVA